MARWFCVLLALTAGAWASDDKSDRATLRGVKAICIVVEVNSPTQADVPLNKDRVQAEIDGKLADAGIPVDPKSGTCLYLNVRPLPAIGRNNKPIGLYAVDLQLEFLQAVTLARDASARAFAPTWSVANLATIPSADLGPTVRQITGDLVNQFVEAFRSVNPK
jgi:hypothetical protein